MEREQGNGEWRENEEMEWDSLSIFPNFLFISSLSISYIKNCVILSQNINSALLLRMSQKTKPTRYEKKILCRVCCEKAPQVVRACDISWHYPAESARAVTGRRCPHSGKGEDFEGSTVFFCLFFYENSSVQPSTAQLQPRTSQYNPSSLLKLSNLLPYLPFQKPHS